MLGNLFRYENDKLYKKRKIGSQWICYNDVKPGSNGYIRPWINGKSMLIHRLVYLFHNPEWNISDNCRDNSIDHINGNKLDNRIENLRVVTHSQNLQNKTHCRGKPVKGVYFHKPRNRWRARWIGNGMLWNKSFKTEAEALEHRAKMVALHYTHDPTKREI